VRPKSKLVIHQQNLALLKPTSNHNTAAVAPRDAVVAINIEAVNEALRLGVDVLAHCTSVGVVRHVIAKASVRPVIQAGDALWLCPDEFECHSLPNGVMRLIRAGIELIISANNQLSLNGLLRSRAFEGDVLHNVVAGVAVVVPVRTNILQ